MDVSTQAGGVQANATAAGLPSGVAGEGGRPRPIPGLRRLVSRKVKERALGYAFLAPALLIVAVFEFFPIAFGFYISLCDWRLGCQAIVGADNYLRGVQDPAMWNALLVTATYSMITTP